MAKMTSKSSNNAKILPLYRRNIDISKDGTVYYVQALITTTKTVKTEKTDTFHNIDDTREKRILKRSVIRTTNSTKTVAKLLRDSNNKLRYTESKSSVEPDETSDSDHDTIKNQIIEGIKKVSHLFDRRKPTQDLVADKNLSKKSWDFSWEEIL